MRVHVSVGFVTLPDVSYHNMKLFSMDTGSFFPLLLGSFLFLLSFLLRLGTAITLIDLLCLLKFLWLPTSSVLSSN